MGFTGASGAGKTTLIERLIARFCAAGLRVAAVKHAHHGFDIDRPGKDSYRFRSAGARQVLLASEQRWALLVEESAPEATGALKRHLSALAPCDLVLVEGFRAQAGVPFIEVRRAPLAAGADAPGAGVVALACDATNAVLAAGLGVPVLPLDDVAAIGDFVVGAAKAVRAC